MLLPTMCIYVKKHFLDSFVMERSIILSCWKMKVIKFLKVVKQSCVAGSLKDNVDDSCEEKKKQKKLK